MRTELIEAYYKSDEYRRKLEARSDLLALLDEEETERARTIVERWAGNPIDFIEQVLYLKITPYNGSIKPFFLFDYQKNILRKLVEAENSNQRCRPAYRQTPRDGNDLAHRGLYVLALALHAELVGIHFVANREGSR